MKIFEHLRTPENIKIHPVMKISIYFLAHVSEVLKDTAARDHPINCNSEVGQIFLTAYISVLCSWGKNFNKCNIIVHQIL